MRVVVWGSDVIGSWCQIDGEGSSLVVSGAEVTDEGAYTCVASNAAGNASVNINVGVICTRLWRPGITFASYNGLFQTTAHRRALCKAFAPPELPP